MRTLNKVSNHRYALIGLLVLLATTSVRGQDASAPKVNDSNQSNPKDSPVELIPRPLVEALSSPLARELFDIWIMGRMRLAAELLFESDENSCEAHYELAKEHQAANRWLPALDETALAIAADPSSFASYHLRAKLYASKELYAHAIATMTSAVAACPDNPIAWALRGCYRSIQHDRVGGLADIEEGFGRLDGNRSNSEWLRTIRGTTYAHLGDYRRCVEEYNSIIADGSFDAADLTARGRSLIWVGEFDRAFADLDAAIALAPNMNRIYLRGLARLRSGRFLEAVADLEQTGKDCPNHLPTQSLLGLSLFAAGRTAESLVQLDRLVAENPYAGEVQTARGWVALMTGDLNKAHQLLNQAVEQPDGRVGAFAFAGYGLWKKPNLDWATAEFENRCRVAPSLPWAFMFREGDAAKTYAIPHPEFTATLVCRVLPDPRLAPWLVVQVVAEHPNQPWRGHAHLGELIASACLRDRSKLLVAVENLIVLWIGGPMPLFPALNP